MASGAILTGPRMPDLPPVTLTATFYAPTESFPTPETADIIVPLSLGVSDAANYFTLDSDAGGSTAVSIPPNTTEAFVEVYCSGNSAEEFWYLSKLGLACVRE